MIPKTIANSSASKYAERSIARKFISFNNIILLSLLLACSAGSFSCKSSKKAAAAAKAKAEQEAREAKLAREREEKRKREEAERLQREEDERARAKAEPSRKLQNYFQQIAGAGSVEAANQSISEALNMFSSPESPLLIVIKKTGDIKDYDKPTTIKKYLEYLKDQKKSANKIDSMVFDDNGKIKEITLITE
ncbi:MAG TPA: nucleoid-structuring protein H-NS [Cytophagaceae bacterium]|jgi:hypothetical protein